jgi:hypothetical protein
VVHLHSTHSVAVSVLADSDPDDVPPALTAYYVMCVGTLPLMPYHAPGDRALAARQSRAGGRRPHAARGAYAIGDLEETAKLFLLLRGERLRPLTPGQAEAAARAPAWRWRGPLHLLEADAGLTPFRKCLPNGLPTTPIGTGRIREWRPI